MRYCSNSRSPGNVSILSRVSGSGWRYLLLLFTHVVFACDVIDDSGQRIHIPQPAQRIISLAPDSTEILFSIGAGQQIVGVVKGSDYPAQALKIPIVANYNSVNIEAIAALHPDLIVTWADNHFSQQLKKLAVPVYFSQPKKITDIPKTMQRLACLTGHEVEAKKVTADFLRELNNLTFYSAHRKPVSVFYQVWSRPLMTISRESWINQIITLCGGKNIFADLKGAAPQVNIEAVIAANPQVILGEGVENWQKWPQLTAVRNHRVYSVHPDWVDRAGPRILLGVREICGAMK
jgi:iron complex transport system substrate-binding protein